MSDQSELDDILKSAYDQQSHRLKKLEESVDELRQVSAEGRRTSAVVVRTALGVAGLAFVAASFVMLRDPAARPWYGALCFTLVVAGVWSYYRKTRG